MDKARELPPQDQNRDADRRSAGARISASRAPYSCVPETASQPPPRCSSGGASRAADLAASPITPGLSGRRVCLQMVDFIVLYVFKAVHHSPAELKEDRTLPKPAPPLQSAGRHVPALGKLALIDVRQPHTHDPHCIAPHRQRPNRWDRFSPAAQEIWTRKEKGVTRITSCACGHPFRAEKRDERPKRCDERGRVPSTAPSARWVPLDQRGVL